KQVLLLGCGFGEDEEVRRQQQPDDQLQENQFSQSEFHGGFLYLTSTAAALGLSLMACTSMFGLSVISIENLRITTSLFSLSGRYASVIKRLTSLKILQAP